MIIDDPYGKEVPDEKFKKKLLETIKNRELKLVKSDMKPKQYDYMAHIWQGC